MAQRRHGEGEEAPGVRLACPPCGAGRRPNRGRALSAGCELVWRARDGWPGARVVCRLVCPQLLCPQSAAQSIGARTAWQPVSDSPMPGTPLWIVAQSSLYQSGSPTVVLPPNQPGYERSWLPSGHRVGMKRGTPSARSMMTQRRCGDLSHRAVYCGLWSTAQPGLPCRGRITAPHLTDAVVGLPAGLAARPSS